MRRNVSLSSVMAAACSWLLLSTSAFQPLMKRTCMHKLLSSSDNNNDGSSIPSSSSSSPEDFDSAGNFVGEYAHILDDGKGHIRSDLATSLWNWDHDRHDHKFQYSTRKGLKMVDAAARELLDGLSTRSYSSTSSSSHRVPQDSSATSYSDLVQEGVVALMQCMANYKEGGTDDGEFEAAAKKHIYDSMSRALANDSRPIRLPAHVHKALKRARNQSLVLAEQLGREPTSAEVARAVGISPEKLDFYRLVSRGTVSVERTVEVYDPLLDATPLYEDEATYERNYMGKHEDELGEEELYEQEGEDEMWVHQEQIAGPLREFIPDGGPTPDDAVLESMIQFDVDNMLLKTLDERELLVIRMRYGIGMTGNNKDKTLQEIASELHISKQRVAQIEQRAMEKLRTSYANRYVERYLDDEEHEDIVDSV